MNNNPFLEKPNCILCGPSEERILFQKKSPAGEIFTLVRCNGCGLQYVSPRPSEEMMTRYYSNSYFTERTDRGYNNYFSPEIRNEIERVFTLNLTDLDFFNYEKSLDGSKHSLDIGCAAGYFVAYLANRGWDAEGIDISSDCISFSQDALKLKTECNDYLVTDYSEKFHLITLWASIEHLHNPQRVIEKAYNDLHENGRLYISTCRVGGVNAMKLFRKKWRFYNFPEHLYFFSHRTLAQLLAAHGFTIERYVTYGSGIGAPGSFIKRIADSVVKRFKAGDMMIISAKKL
ncbi:MAG TPA: class I SAM-dependent methyltransferase [Spirochaetota bacterium]|nr:class I SAM-dependent methyltransferase [Spirochaetota bacterium]